MVYKLVAHRDNAGAWVSVAKKSDGKTSMGGRKHPIRRLDESGTASAEVVHIVGAKPVTDSGRELLVPLIVDGALQTEYLGPAGVAAARAHRESAVAELPAEAFRLGRGDPVLPTLYL
jgi:nicotinate phosphoribosyltransferase